MDLQDTEAPSAKDHSRQPTTPSALGEGHHASHQANALKSAGLDGIELRSRSPRASQDLSGKEIQLLQNHEEGDQTVETNLDEIGLGLQDGELDSDGEGSIEDDMMDKISSSPSIDDGGLFSQFFTQQSIVFHSHGLGLNTGQTWVVLVCLDYSEAMQESFILQKSLNIIRVLLKLGSGLSNEMYGGFHASPNICHRTIASRLSSLECPAWKLLRRPDRYIGDYSRDYYTNSWNSWNKC